MLHVFSVFNLTVVFLSNCLPVKIRLMHLSGRRCKSISEQHWSILNNDFRWSESDEEIIVRSSAKAFTLCSLDALEVDLGEKSVGVLKGGGDA